MKFVVVVLAILLLVWLLLGSSRRRAKEARREDPPAAQGPPQVEGMVACAHCGVHLPGSLAVQSRGLAYCSVTHRDAGPRAS